MSTTPHNLDLSKLGRTNLYHTDEERRLIYEAICQTKEALQRVNEEKRILMLRAETLQSDLSRYLSAYAPIKRLPDDVLSNIIELHCQDALPVVIPLSDWHTPPQITLSHVCSTWRQLVLHIPGLWCNIELVPYLTDDFAKMMEVVHMWLSRARSLPCSVNIISTNHYSVWRQDWYRNIVKDFFSLYKFRKIGATFADYHLRELLQLPDEKLRCIEDLCLRHVEINDSSNGEVTYPYDVHKLSSLTSFSLLSDLFSEIPQFVGMFYEDTTRLGRIPWHQLRHVRIHLTFSVAFYLKMLELSSPVLESCWLDVYEDNLFGSSSWALRKPICCNKLWEFKVEIHSPDFPPEADDITDPFLGLLRCPNLKSLTIGPFEQSIPRSPLPLSINLQTLLKMQQESKMRLEELIISNTFRDLDVLSLLANFPSLHRLVLPQTIAFTEDAMDELGSGSIAPWLEDLTIKKPFLALTPLLQMIKTRSSAGKEDSARKYKPTPFKSVILQHDGHEQMEYTDTIEEINRSGVNLKVNRKSYDELIPFGPWEDSSDIYTDNDYDYGEDTSEW